MSRPTFEEPGVTSEPKPRRVGRPALLVPALVVAGASMVATWWMTTLYGLPDVGDPFDAAGFVDTPMSDEENAYVLYREAHDRIGPEPAEMSYDWATADPSIWAWLDRSREALEIWRRGTERPKSLYLPARSITHLTRLPVVGEIRKFVRLAQLEGSRLEAQGDLEGAWRWHRAIFRSGRHVGFRATTIERLVGATIHDVACRQLTRWANDPRVTPTMLRRALDAVLSDYATTGRLSDNLKVEYLAFLKTVEDPDLARKCLADEDTFGPGQVAWFARDVNLFGIMKVLKKEPERSRRVARLVFANLLEAADRPPERRPPVAGQLPYPIALTGRNRLIDLYAMTQEAPAAARALPLDKVVEWFETTLYARRMLPIYVNTVIQTADRERATQAGLVLALANRLYELERGKPPETYEELVGPYFKALPEGYSPIR